MTGIGLIVTYIEMREASDTYSKIKKAEMEAKKAKEEEKTKKEEDKKPE